MRGRTIHSITRPTGTTKESVFHVGGTDLGRWDAVGKNADVRSMQTRAANLPNLGQVRMSSFAGNGFLALLPPNSGTGNGFLVGGHDDTQLLSGHQQWGYCACRFLAAGANEWGSVGVTFPMQCTNVPTINFFLAGAFVNIQAFQANAITIRGFAFNIQSVAGGDTNAEFLYQTAGN